jgi:hypothetical protein
MRGRALKTSVRKFVGVVLVHTFLVVFSIISICGRASQCCLASLQRQHGAWCVARIRNTLSLRTRQRQPCILHARDYLQEAIYSLLTATSKAAVIKRGMHVGPYINTRMATVASAGATTHDRLLCSRTHAEILHQPSIRHSIPRVVLRLTLQHRRHGSRNVDLTLRTMRTRLLDG